MPPESIVVEFRFGEGVEENDALRLRVMVGVVGGIKELAVGMSDGEG